MKTVTDDQIKHMVNRFLGWRLPENFSPDGGVSFKRTFNDHMDPPGRYQPVGTNLLDAGQAEAMVRHMVEGLILQALSTGPAHDAGLLEAKARVEAKLPKGADQRLVIMVSVADLCLILQALAGFDAHTEAVGAFLNELYAVMVDPCAEGAITVAEMKDQLLAAAQLQRQALAGEGAKVEGPTPPWAVIKIIEALGFDPTNHHNAAKCPYCNPHGRTFHEITEALATQSAQMVEALKPFARIAGPINGEEGRPTYLEAIERDGGTGELYLSSPFASNGRPEVMWADDFRAAARAISEVAR